MSTPASEIHLQLAHSRLSPDDERWTGQVVELARALSAQGSGIRVEPSRTALNTKGFAIGEMILALTSVGSLRVLLETLQAWLRRDKSRQVEIRMTDGGNERTITITADRLDNSAMEALLEGISKNLRF